MYDNAAMSMYVLGIVMAWRLLGAVFFGFALYHSRRSGVAEEDDDDGDKLKESGGGEESAAARDRLENGRVPAGGANEKGR